MNFSAKAVSVSFLLNNFITVFTWEYSASTVTMQSKHAVVNVSFIQSVALKVFMAYSSLDYQW